MAIKTKEVVVENIAALSTAKVGDGDFVQVLGYSGVGDGGGQTLRYEATGTDSINGGTTFPGVGGSLSFDGSNTFNGTAGTGRFFSVLNDRVVTAEMFGCDGTGATVCTNEFQRFLNFIAGNEEFVFKAVGRYSIDDTLRLEDARWFNLQIGQSGAAKNRGAKMTGLEYTGPGGTSFTPSECKPVLVLYRCSDFIMPSCSIWQVSDGTEQENTTGLLVHGGDSNQRGYCTMDELSIVGFGYGLIMGLSNAADGTYRDTGTYNDDIFENWHIQDARISGCKRAMYVDSATADGSRIDSLWLGNYRPGVVDPNFGPTDAILECQECGNWSVGVLQLVQAIMGVSSFQVTAANVDTATDTLTFTAHGLSNNDRVHLEQTSNSTTMPGNLPLSTLYYVVNSTANTFQLSLDASGSAIDITSAPSEDIQVIKVDGSEAAMKGQSFGTLTVEKGNCEQEFCKLLDVSSGADARNGITMTNMSCIPNSRDINDVCIRCLSALRLHDSQLAGWADVDMDSFNGTANWFFDPGWGFRDVNSSLARTPYFAGTLQRADTSSPLDSTSDINTFISNPILYTPGHLTFVSPFDHEMTGEFTIVSGVVGVNIDVGDTSAFIAAGTYRDPVLFETSSGDVLPGGFQEYTRYESRNIVNANRMNFFDPQDASSLLSPNASGATGAPVMHRATDIWKYSLVDSTSHRISLEADVTFSSQNAVGTAYTKLIKCYAVFAMNGSNVWNINTFGQTLGESNVGITDPNCMAGFGLDLDSSGRPVMYLAAAAKSSAPVECIATIKVQGLRAGNPISHHFNLASDLSETSHYWLQSTDVTVSAADLTNGYVTLSGIFAREIHDVYRNTDRDESFSFDYASQRLTLGATFLATLSASDVIKVRYGRP